MCAWGEVDPRNSLLDSAHQLRCFLEGECHFVPVAIFLNSLLDFAYQQCCYPFSALLLLESLEGLCHLFSAWLLYSASVVGPIDVRHGGVEVISVVPWVV